MPESRSIHGNAFSWPTASSTSSQSNTTSGPPAGTKLRMKKRTQDDYSDPAYSPQVGLLVGNVKACFNSRAELAMAVYELQQFGRKETAVQVELVPVQQ